MNTTFWIAIYGAVLATAALGVDVVKWLRSGARIRISGQVNTYYSDSEPLEVEDDSHEGFGPVRLKPWIQVEITNVGDRSTTILDVGAFYEKPVHRWSNAGERTTVGWSSSAFQMLSRGQLPVKLEPGAVWTARLDQALVMETRDSGFVKDWPFMIGVRASHTPKLIRHKVFGRKNLFFSSAVSPRRSLPD